MANTNEKEMNILEYINYLVEVEGYTEENAERCADCMFNLELSED